MNENVLDKKNDSPKIAKKHVMRYIDDLQRHFNLSDEQIVKILTESIASFKKKDSTKKWWQIF